MINSNISNSIRLGNSSNNKCIINNRCNINNNNNIISVKITSSSNNSNSRY